MSGGTLERTYQCEEWASQLRKVNPLFADMLADTSRILSRYDYYISGDIGEDAIEKEWKAFCTKWMNMDPERFAQMAKEECMDIVDSMVKGHGRRMPWE